MPEFTFFRTAQSKRVCRCENPRERHPNGFRYEGPPYNGFLGHRAGVRPKTIMVKLPDSKAWAS